MPLSRTLTLNQRLLPREGVAPAALLLEGATGYPLAGVPEEPKDEAKSP